MNRKKIHTLLDEAIDGFNKVNDELSNVVTNAVDSVKTLVTPNKFQLGQVVAYTSDDFEGNCMVVNIKLTHTKAVLYTLRDNFDNKFDNISEEALSA